MTTRTLATKLKRLESLAKMHPGWMSRPVSP
jgi:hypothetical protein